MPKDLSAQITELERVFTVDQERLKQITDHFVSELERGMHCVGVTHAPSQFLTATFRVEHRGRHDCQFELETLLHTANVAHAVGPNSQ